MFRASRDLYPLGFIDKDRAQVGNYIKGVSSATACQALCQEVLKSILYNRLQILFWVPQAPDCVYFIYRDITEPGNEYQREHGCLLKNNKIFTQATSIAIRAEMWNNVFATDPRWTYCNMNISYDCFHGLKKCLGKVPQYCCVWEGYHFISGPKYCTGENRTFASF